MANCKNERINNRQQILQRVVNDLFQLSPINDPHGYGPAMSLR